MVAEAFIGSCALGRSHAVQRRCLDRNTRLRSSAMPWHADLMVMDWTAGPHSSAVFRLGFCERCAARIDPVLVGGRGPDRNCEAVSIRFDWAAASVRRSAPEGVISRATLAASSCCRKSRLHLPMIPDTNVIALILNRRPLTLLRPLVVGRARPVTSNRGLPRCRLRIHIRPVALRWSKRWRTRPSPQWLCARARSCSPLLSPSPHRPATLAAG